MQEEKVTSESELEQPKEVEPEQPKGVELEGTKEEEITKEELMKRLNEKSEEAAINYDRWLRVSAELENYKKRVEREKAEFLKYAHESLIKELLPIVDNLERAIDHARTKKASKAFVEGIEMVLKSFNDCLGKFKVKPIKAIGAKFDPNLHEAVTVEEKADEEENTILSELQKGYMLNDRVIRPAMVVVSRRPERAEGEEKITN
ncbi:MAG TPA: nucleotide exchange factor GrpE [Syntrophaceae bacterium]|nr:nucleotide exchange factor GrpE [Syntrophaceae bacterium]